MKIKQTLLLLFLLIAALPLSSFKNNAGRIDTIYCFLRYDVLAKDSKTHVLIVSNTITYDDWKENSLDIKKKFAAKAIEQTGVEVWQPSIKDAGLSSSEDDVKIARAKALNRFKEYYEASKTYTIDL
jgi:hypothetical protein